MNKWLHYKLLGWLQRKCKHPPETVTFDIREQSIEEHDSIKWCRVCGAARIGLGDWREPRADWWIETEYTKGARSAEGGEGSPERKQ